MKGIFNIVLSALLSAACFSHIASAELMQDDKSVYPGTTLRYHPGHYVLLWGSLSGENSIPQKFIDEMTTNNFVGMQRAYFWMNLEVLKEPGLDPTSINNYTYDFTLIRKDINQLKAIGCHPGCKRLIIGLSDTTYNTAQWAHAVPAYMRTPDTQGPYYGGEKAFSPTRINAKRWVPAVSERYRALITALAAAFKDEPYVEAVRTGESSLNGLQKITYPAGPQYSDKAYLAQLNANTDTLWTAFPNTVTVQFANWGDYMDSLHAYTLANGKHVGWGGPDIYTNAQPPVPAYTYHSAHDGKGPLLANAEWEDFHRGSTPAQILNYAIWGSTTFNPIKVPPGATPLKLNYIAWDRGAGNFDNCSAPANCDIWEAILATINDPKYAPYFPVRPRRF